LNTENIYVNVKNVFDKYRIINVPYYQREYVWGTKNNGMNLYKFIDDVFNQYQTNKDAKYFIGTLAFCSDETNDVIDGQQRLTSLILILSILASGYCSQDVKDENKNLLFPENNKFVIQEETYLTEELKAGLGYPSNFTYSSYSVNILETINRIKRQILDSWSNRSPEWYDELYHFILNNVYLISLEYDNIGDALKYFLNINSLSIQLTQADIFYSILSQSIRISGCTNVKINGIKQKIKELGSKPGITQSSFDLYKNTYDFKDEIGVNNVVYIFLNSYFKDDRNILELGDLGIGKWMSFYKNTVFNDPVLAKEFVENFVQYLADFEDIYNYLSHSVNLEENSSLCLSWILLQYEKYEYIASVLMCIFKTKHNYVDTSNNLYEENTKKIDANKLNEIAKRLNLTIIKNYIECNIKKDATDSKDETKKIIGFVKNIEYSNGNYTRSIQDIVSNIDFKNIFTLTYNDNKSVSNTKIKNFSKEIKAIMGCQESYLDKTVDNSNDFNTYLKDLIFDESFSIEHLYSVKEYNDNTRLNNWRTKKNLFGTPEEFDTARYDFKNLSLLDKSANSSAGSDEIRSKLETYKGARKILGHKYEYLVQSLVDGSEYYNNTNIQALGLPERKIKNIDQNTWELSENNRDFNIKLLKLAVDEIANK